MKTRAAPATENRCQDIEELLQAGIDIYTTLDVQHIESIQDTVSEILALRPRSGFRTGCSIRPRAWNSWTVNRKTCGNA